MYAIVDIAGQQFKVEKEQEIFVHRLQEEAGADVEFENVLMVDNDGKVSVGTPNVDGIKIKAKIIEHLKGDKVIVFHKKRRKGYQKQNGHRQYLSKVLIEDILTGVAKKETKEVKVEAKAEAKAKVEVKTETKTEKKETKAKAAPKTETKAKAKAEVAPKTDKKPEKKTVKKVATIEEKKPKVEATAKKKPKDEQKTEEKKED